MGSKSFQNTESISCFRILTPWYKVGLFHPLQALVHRYLLSVTAVSNSVVICLTLVAFPNLQENTLWMNSALT